MRKEGVRGLPVCNRLDETMPLIHPVVAATTLTLFVAMYTANRQVTPFTPVQSTSQGLPEFWIKKCFFCGHDKGRIIILARPRGIIVRGSLIHGVHPVRPVDVVAPFNGFIYSFWDRHKLFSFSPPLRM